MPESNRLEKIEFKPNDAASANARLTTRRAALRKLGITTGAALFGLLAGDELIRAVATGVKRSHSNSVLAELVAREFNDSGIAFAAPVPTIICGVEVVPRKYCESSDCGSPPCPCPSGTYPWRGCTAPSDCSDCMTVADWKFCECQQALDNLYPLCCDCNGVPNGYPECAAFSAGITACSVQYRYDSQQC